MLVVQSCNQPHRYKLESNRRSRNKPINKRKLCHKTRINHTTIQPKMDHQNQSQTRTNQSVSLHRFFNAQDKASHIGQADKHQSSGNCSTAWSKKHSRTLLWRECIKKIWEVDPLTCPKCAGEMGIISFIYKKAVIKKILVHLAVCRIWEALNRPKPNKCS